jgi:hypothetical protein
MIDFISPSTGLSTLRKSLVKYYHGRQFYFGIGGYLLSITLLYSTDVILEI